MQLESFGNRQAGDNKMPYKIWNGILVEYLRINLIKI